MIKPTTSSLVAGYTRQSAQRHIGHANAGNRNTVAEHAPRKTDAPLTTSSTSPQSAAGSASALGETLSAAEQDLIGNRFPESPRMALRLYGPARPAGPGQPTIGSLLDIKG